MADFISNLWESVFTAGPTPTLLIATNVTFGALQVLLAALLIATYSIHFAILSVLCGGLWYSINWFANELQQAQAKEAEADRLRRKKRSENERAALGDGEDHADDEGEDTEVEGGLKESTASLSPVPLTQGGDADKLREQIAGAIHAPSSQQEGGASSGLQATAGASDARQRRQDDGYKSASELSTDSEWEKVDEDK